MARSEELNSLSFNVHQDLFKTRIENIDSPKVQESIINSVAHEMTHLKEYKLEIKKW